MKTLLIIVSILFLATSPAWTFPGERMPERAARFANRVANKTEHVANKASRKIDQHVVRPAHRMVERHVPEGD